MKDDNVVGFDDVLKSSLVPDDKQALARVADSLLKASLELILDAKKSQREGLREFLDILKPELVAGLHDPREWQYKLTEAYYRHVEKMRELDIEDRRQTMAEQKGRTEIFLDAMDRTYDQHKDAYKPWHGIQGSGTKTRALLSAIQTVSALMNQQQSAPNRPAITAVPPPPALPDPRDASTERIIRIFEELTKKLKEGSHE